MPDAKQTEPDQRTRRTERKGHQGKQKLGNPPEPLRLLCRSRGRYRAAPDERTGVAQLRSRSRKPSLENEFRRLTSEWKEQSAALSSPTEIAVLPAYQRIVGMGQSVVPLILREMEQEPDFWFWALRAITGADPVSPEIRGNVPEMTASWLSWAEKRGYQW